MRSLGRIDRIILFLATAVLGLAGMLILGYDYLAQMDLATGEVVGEIVEKSGAVRKKSKSSFRWSPAGTRQGLAFGDSLYVEQGAKTTVNFNGATLKLAEKTLVNFVFRKKHKMVNIQFGEVEGSIQAGEKLILMGKSGKPIELTSAQGGKFKLKADEGGQIQLSSKVEGMNVTVNGVRRALSNTKPLSLKSDQTIPEKEQLRLVIPLPQQNFIVEESKVVNFQWKPSRPIYSEETFKIEFSRDPGFRNIFAQKKIVGRQQVKVRVKGDDLFYWRVKGDSDWAPSEVRQLLVTRKAPPQILRPQKDSQLKALPGQPLAVPFQFEFARYSRQLRWQVSRTKEFSQMDIDETTSSSQVLKPLLPGRYFARAKSFYADGGEGRWGKTTEFTIRHKVPSLAYELFPNPDKRIIIPNRDYPRYLYNSNTEGVTKYLKKRRFMSRYFVDPRAKETKVRVFFDPGYQSDILTHWPREKMRPGKYSFLYRLERPPLPQGPWSKKNHVRIAMEPPYKRSQKLSPVARTTKTLKADLNWTPILFAKSYEVELKANGSLAPARKRFFKNPDARMKVTSGVDYRWRVRARDKRNKVISGYSPWYNLKTSTSGAYLAQKKIEKEKRTEEKKSERKVAGRLRKKMKEERKRRPYRDLSGYSFWVGAGYNLVDYKQTVVNKSNFNYSDARGPSQFLELSYMGRKGLGGTFNYKATPGKVKIENRSIDKSDSNWQTISAEANYKRDSGWTTPMGDFIYGVRAGVQYHSIPFVHLDNNSDLTLEENTMITASVGPELEFWRQRWRYSMHMRYQIPLSTAGTGGNEFTITPQLAFDGSLGVSYLLGNKMKLGLFWYGQFHEYDFVFNDGTVENTGDQSLFFSNVDFRFGFNF